MRISDWSSDVCSSDLGVAGNLPSLEALEALLTDTGLTWSTTPAGAILLHDLVKPTDKGRNAAGHARPDEQWQEAPIIDELHRRTEERRVGREWGSTGRSRRAP